MTDLERILGPEGPLAREIPGFRHRPQQVEFAQAVEKAIEMQGVLIAEAGTGTGKTFAYLVPALISGGKVIVSTGTKTLQDQLFHRDLPRVREVLGVAVDVALLKGRANYVCLHHLEIAVEEGRFGSREDSSNIHKIQRFARNTMSGDRSDCGDVPETSAAWAQATSTRENCLGSNCKHYDECFVMKARKRAAEADVVVVNHHLFFADVVLRDEGAGDLLPAANTVIFDEAHHLPDLARLFFGESVSTAQAIELARDARTAGLMKAKESPEIGDAAHAVDRAARDVRISLGAVAGRVALNAIRQRPEFDRALDALAEKLGELSKLLQAHEERAEELRNARVRADEFAGRIADWRELDARERDPAEVDTVRWIEAYSHAAALYVTPLDVAAIFRQQIEGSKRAWIFTSATLSVAGDFRHYQSEMGLAEAVTANWPSPFDFEKQALLYVPEELPDPNSEGYTDAVVEASWPVVRASGGHAFLLFTSLRAMNLAHERIGAKLKSEGLEWPLLLQGSGSKNELLERFRKSPNAILVGSQSFWEGVDVKGDQLSVVVIDRLPFNPPDDPVLAACIERINRAGGNAFMDYQVPRAVIALKQGAGRLIRDETDRGVLVICDPRLITKPYGKRIWRALPPFRRTRSIEAVEAFFTGTPAAASPSHSGTA
ncbi:ATP-dependent DNA helicase [Usitatibacter palustris]|uniref:Putative ATP-dependent DNA helicase YoaA n=1 Tax=Usitatibacter palustris TaxID=2732487 RepID=A0A6M4H5R4_9PROT|nr:ATP-dependent DNA helicase [Usitatibacter palustris]QJR14991.1 putative ATP-dependent DNA helicase YoaA [Usitatibacter palustris]